MSGLIAGFDPHPNCREENIKKMAEMSPTEQQAVFNEAMKKLASRSMIPPPKGVAPRTCAFCLQPGSKVCTACRSVAYCSVEHQKSHWKTHKIECKKAQEAVDTSVKFDGTGLPPRELMMEALMAQGGKAEYLQSITSIESHAPNSWRVNYHFFYDQTDQGDKVALVSLEDGELVLQSWNWRPEGAPREHRWQDLLEAS